MNLLPTLGKELSAGKKYCWLAKICIFLHVFGANSNTIDLSTEEPKKSEIKGLLTIYIFAINKA